MFCEECAAPLERACAGCDALVAHCHFGLAKLHASPHPQPLSRSGERVARTGQREEARERLATATTLYREMDMRFWLEQAQTALAPSHVNPP
jgi:hypothetical protein